MKTTVQGLQEGAGSLYGGRADSRCDSNQTDQKLNASILAILDPRKRVFVVPNFGGIWRKCP
jgi:hypothetical protein